MVNEKRFSILSYPNNLVIGITIIASFVSFLYIGQKSIWIDEAYSILFAKMQWGEFWAVLSSPDLSQGLYYFLLRFWLIFGDSEVAVRSLSALFSIASIPVLYALASRLFDARAGLITILLLPGNAFFVKYAQEARSYSLVLFLVVLSSYLFVRIIEDPSNKKILCGYVCISALAVYAHFFGVLVLIAQTLSVPFLPSNKFRFRRLALANLLIAALLTPIVIVILTKDHGVVAWIPKPTLSSLRVLFDDLTGNAGRSGYITSFYLLPCIITLTHALVTFVRTRRSIDTWRYALIVLWLVVPIVLVYGYSLKEPLFVNRYFIVSLPGLVLLSGVGIALIRDKYCSTILLLLLMALSVYSTLTGYYPREKENFRDSASYVVSHAQRGDGILFYVHFTTIPFEYYWRRLNPPRDLLDSVYPSKLGHYIWREDHPNPSVLYLESLKDRYERIWVVSSHAGGKRSIVLRSILTTFEQYYELEEEKDYEGIRVLLFVRK